MYQSLWDRLRQVRGFIAFGLIVVVFGILAGRIAFTSPFPMPFDETYHFGLTRLHADQVSPIITSQAPSADIYGAVANEPSFLFHYLMSLPLRLAELFTSNQLTQVYILRGLNIALAVWTLYLVVRLGRRCGLSGLWAYGAAAAMAITPAFYDLSAHINYDNMMLPLGLLAIMLAIDVVRSARAGNLALARLTVLLAVLASASLVKYSFLPIGLAIGLFTAVLLFRYLKLRQLPSQAADSVRQWSWPRRAAVMLPLLVMGGLCVQLYGGNVARYGTPHPQCHIVLSVERCMQYGPWARNYQLHQTRAERQPAENQLVPYSAYWLRAMYLQLFSRVNVADNKAIYTEVGPALMAIKTLVVIGLLGALVALRRLSRYAGLPVLLFGTVTLLYGAALWAQNYSDFTNLNAIVAVQGRYLLPVLPLLYVLVAVCYMAATQRVRRTVRNIANPSRRGQMMWTVFDRYL